MSTYTDAKEGKLPPAPYSTAIVRRALQTLNKSRLAYRAERDALANNLAALVDVLDDWGIDEDNHEVAEAMYKAQVVLREIDRGSEHGDKV
jgi:hypothetical protein